MLLLATVVAVVAAGSGVAFWATRGGNDHRASSGAHVLAVDRSTPGGAVLAGTRWRLVSVRTDARTVAIPARLRAGVAFAPGGRFSADDGVNDYSGGYRATRDGVVIGELAGTAVGYVGHDPAVEAAVRGIGALQGAVSTLADRATLTMRVAGRTLAFARDDLDPGFTGVSDPASGSGSATAPPASTSRS